MIRAPQCAAYYIFHIVPLILNCVFYHHWYIFWGSWQVPRLQPTCKIKTLTLSSKKNISIRDIYRLRPVFCPISCNTRHSGAPMAPAGLYVLVAARFLHFSSNLLSLKREQSSFISRKNRKTGIKLVSNHNRPRSPGHLDHLASRMI